MKKALEALDAMVDLVLAYRPRRKAKTKAVKRKRKKRGGLGKIVNS
jgi:hypothetical protein